jgi:hypothetical protein
MHENRPAETSCHSLGSVQRNECSLEFADILATATIWAGTHTVARDEIFNITNGDYFRWQHMRPRIAKMFDMDTAHPVPMPFAVYMPEKGDVWNRIVREHNLQATLNEQVAS